MLGFWLAITVFCTHVVQSEGAYRNSTAPEYDAYVADYITAVHGIGDCEYKRGCSPQCLATHLRLRDNGCFKEYINFHNYLCPSFHDVGEKCDSDLARHCENPVNAWNYIPEPQTVTVVGAFPGAKRPFARLYLHMGIVARSEEDSECEIRKADRDLLEFYGGTSSYGLPIESERQVDPDPAFYFTSSGANGLSLHEMKRQSSVTYHLPETFRLVQVDADDVDVVFGVVHGGCASSMHSLQNDEIAFSLCRFSKYSGVVDTVQAWNASWSCAVTGSVAALNPVRRKFYLVVYDEVTGSEYVAAVDVGESNTLERVTRLTELMPMTLMPIPPQAQGVVESLFFDIKHDAILMTVMDGSLYKMFEIETALPVPTFHHMGDFSLEEGTDQRYALISNFDAAQHSIAEPARVLTVVFENTLRQYDVRESVIEPRSSSYPSGHFASRYLALANFEGMVLSSLYLDRHPVLSGGKDNIWSPSVVFEGEFEKLILGGESIDVELNVADLDTLSHDIILDAFSSNPAVIQDEELDNIWSPERCQDLCLSSLTPSKSILRITPRPGRFGTSRITVTASDGGHITKASFVVYAPPGDCEQYNTADVVPSGCQFRRRAYDPVPHHCEAIGLEPGLAGEQFTFQIRSADQFNHAVLGHDMSLQFNTSLIIGDSIIETLVQHSDDGEGIYDAVTSESVTVAGSFFIRIEATFVVRTVHTRYEGLQIPGSPYQVMIRPAELHFPSCIVAGIGLSVAKQGSIVGSGDDLIGQGADSSFGGNSIYIVARDRFLNIRTATGEDHFGVSFSSNLTGGVTPSNRNDGWYSVKYWVPDAIYNHSMRVCTLSIDDFSSGGCDSAGPEDITPVYAVYVLPYEFWYYNRAQAVDPANSQFFTMGGCHQNTDAMAASGNGNRRLWNGDLVEVQECEMAIAGTPFSVYVQTRDEFDRILTGPIDRAPNRVFDSFTYIFGKYVNGTHEYVDNGVYKITITLTRAHFPQTVFTEAREMPIFNSPVFIQVTPAVLSSRKSFADGPATVMAQEGTRNTLAAGNILYLHARDSYGNVRLNTDDRFSLDPNTESSFLAEVTPMGNGTYEAKFWWEVEFVQTYDICIRDTQESIDSPYVGNYGHCIFRCERKVGCDQVTEQRINDDGDTVNMDVCRCQDGHGEESGVVMENGLREDDRAIQQVTVFIKANEGSPFTNPNHAVSICMNNIFDDFACHMRTGQSGDLSSFTIEAKNELDLPNYRGEDYYVAKLQAGPDVSYISGEYLPLVYSAYLRIQFYEMVYTVTLAGTYTMNVYLCTREVEAIPDFPDVPGLTSGDNVFYQDCKRDTVGDSPYAVLVSPGFPDPTKSLYSFPPSFNVGGENVISITAMDYWENPVMMDDDHILHVFARRSGVTESFTPERPPGEASNSTSGGYVASAILRTSGSYNMSIQIWVRDTDTGEFAHRHIVNSPALVFLHPAAFSIRFTAIEGFVAGETTDVVASRELSLPIHAKDQYTNDVVQEHLEMICEFTPAQDMVRTFIFEDVNDGAYRVPYDAILAGVYDLYLAVVMPGDTTTYSANGSPFRVRVVPGPALTVLTSGAGLTGGTAGVYTTFRLVLRDEFLNVRTTQDRLDTSLSYEDSTMSFAEQRRSDVNVTTVTTDEEIATWAPELAGSTNRVSYQGAGVYDGFYMAEKAGVYRPVFAVDGVLLTGELFPYSISFGFQNEPRLDPSPIIEIQSDGEGRPTAVAGRPITLQLQLLDRYANPRFINDAVVTVVYQQFGASGKEDFAPAAALVEYSTNGIYLISFQMNSMGSKFMIVTVSDSCVNDGSCDPRPAGLDAAEPWPPAFAVKTSQFYSPSSGLSIFVRAGPTVASECEALPDSIVVSGTTPHFNIILKDRFRNQNFLESTLEWRIQGTGVAVFDGQTAWDPANTVFVASYAPIRSGPYSLRIELIRTTEAGAIYELVNELQIRVNPGDVDPSRSMATGLGVIRVTPFPCTTCEENGNTEFILQAKDANDNPVTADILGGLNGASPATASALGRVSIQIQTEALASHSCAFEMSGRTLATPNGNNFITYRTPWDATGNGESFFCQGLPVEYATIRYRIKVMIDGQAIRNSPYTLRVGNYIAPAHSPYLSRNPAGTDLTEVTSSGPIQYQSMVLNLLAGQQQDILFQNVYRAGFPGCEEDACEVRADDPSFGQVEDTIVGARGEFELVASQGTTQINMGSKWSFVPGLSSRSVAEAAAGGCCEGASFSNMGEGVADYGRYTLDLSIFFVGVYQLNILTGGEPIDGCPINVTLVPNVADPGRTLLSGPGLIGAQVDVATTVTALVRDQYDNYRETGDTVGIDFRNDVGTYGAESPVQRVATEVEIDGNVRDISAYTLTYTIERFVGFARLYVFVNGVGTTVDALRISTLAGPIATQSYPLSRDQAETPATTAQLVAGQRERITFQAADSHGNLRAISQAGATCAITQTCTLGATMTIRGNETTPLLVVDNLDGTYRVSYDVIISVDHLIHISVDGEDIIDSPFTATVVPDNLSPANCLGNVPTSALVGATRSVLIEQRDRFDNAITEYPVGRFLFTLEGSPYEGTDANPLRIEFDYTISGNRVGVLTYRCGTNDPTNQCSDGVVMAANYGQQFIVLFHPETADIARTVVREGALKVRDCIATQQATFVLQTRDVYGNDCDRSTVGEVIMANMIACDPPNDATCGTLDESTANQYVFTDLENGQFTVTYTTEETGYYQMVLYSGSAVLTVPESIVTRTPPSFVILSDTAAVPLLCSASGGGLGSTIAGELASYEIVAMGQGAGGAPVSRRGSGDEFRIQLDAGGVTQVCPTGDILPPLTCHNRIPMPDSCGEPNQVYTTNGRYDIEYVARAENQVVLQWPVTMSIELVDDASIWQHISGSPFTITMVPAVTASIHTFAVGLGLVSAVTGIAALTTVTGRDRFNNRISECTPEHFSDSYIVVGSEVSEIRDSQVDMLPSTCTSGVYELPYYTETAAYDYVLHIKFLSVEILGSPFDVVISAAAISGSTSFISQHAVCPTVTHGANAIMRVEEQCFVGRTDLPVGVAGVITTVYLHTYDRYYNKLTAPPCTTATDCILLRAAWCQVSRDLTVMSDLALIECPSSQDVQAVLTWMDGVNATVYEQTGTTGVYAAEFVRTVAGTYSLLPLAIEASGDQVHFHLDHGHSTHTGYAVEPAPASAPHTVAAPSDVAIATEQIEFGLVARDRFENNVDTQDLNFTLTIIFRNNIRPTDPDSGVELEQAPTSVRFDADTNSYIASYIVNTIQPTFMALQITLDGVDIWDEPFPVTVRSAQNVPAKCYVISDEIGTPARRVQNLSRDLYNLDNKMAGEQLVMSIQSIGKTGPRSGYGVTAGRTLCTADQIANNLITDCDLLDEFNVVAVTSQDHPNPGQRVPGAFGSYCTETIEAECLTAVGGCASGVPWDPNDCARLGFYMLSWTTEISGFYNLRVFSFGVLIQTGQYDSVCTAGIGNVCEETMSVPPHDFSTSRLGTTLMPGRGVMPVRVYINPAPMDALMSEAYIQEVLDLYQTADVLVIGHDRFGNYVDRNGGQAVHMRIRVTSQCTGVQPLFTANFVYQERVTACTGTCTGRFQGSITPRYAGPSVTEIFYDDSGDCETANSCYTAGNLVRNEPLPSIVRLAVSRPTPNTGHIDGGTVVQVPMAGICPLYPDVWASGFSCIFAGVGIGSAQTSVSATLTSDTYPSRVHLSVVSASGADEIVWEIQRRAPSGPRFTDFTIGGPGLEAIDCDAVGVLGVPLGVDCSVDHSETLLLPPGHYRIQALNDTWHDAVLIVKDDYDNVLLNVSVGQLGPRNSTFDFAREIDPMIGLTCERTPEVLDSLLRNNRLNDVGLSVGAIYRSGDGATTSDIRYQSFDSSRIYRSINDRQFFYYVHPEFSEVRPKNEVLANATVDLWTPHQFVFVTRTGAATIYLDGYGFDNGGDADKDSFKCVFFDRNCTYNGTNPCNVEPLFSQALIANPPEGVWSSNATYLNDGRVSCAVPDFDAGWAVRDLQVEVSLNGQEARASLLSNDESTVASGDDTMQYTWIRVFDLLAVAPSVSAIAGNIPVTLDLVNPDPDLNGLCRFGNFPNSDNTTGLPLVPAARVSDTQLQCIVPQVDGGDILDASGVEVDFNNQMVPIVVSFDGGETFSDSVGFFFYAQPDVSLLFPPVGPTSGGTELRLELLAGERYNNVELDLIAFDYANGADQYRPNCLFKNQAGLARGLFSITPGRFELQERAYLNDQFNRDGTYLSQQIVCIAPSNPTPGAAYYVDISLDGVTYAYENGAKVNDPKQFGYYADVAIITMDANDKYNAQVSFRTAIAKGDATVTVRFAYSCGYAEQYSQMVRCLFGNVTSSASPGSLRFGADITNSIDCMVPQDANPSVTTIQLALNGVDFTDITTQTEFTYYGTPVSLGAAYVTSVWENDRQRQFTTAAAERTQIQLVICEIVDLLGSYVSASEEFGALGTTFTVMRQFGSELSEVYNDTSTLSHGFTSYGKDSCNGGDFASDGIGRCEGIVFFKPRSGGQYRLQFVIAPSADGNILEATEIEMVIVVGATSIENSVIAELPPPLIDINPGNPFFLRVLARDSAGNNRVEGADVIRIRSNLVNSSELSAVEYFNPSAVSNVVRDNADGSYDCESTVLADSQRDDSNSPIRIWGAYELSVEGYNTSGMWQHVKGSPMRMGPNLDDPPRIEPVDCSMSGLLEGAEPNTAGDTCICTFGFQKSENQQARGTSLQHMVCDPCPIGTFKDNIGNDVSCEECPVTTWTEAVGGLSEDDCICEPGKMPIETDANCISQNWHPTPKSTSSDLCIDCPQPCIICAGFRDIEIEVGYWSDNEKPYVSYYCGNSAEGACKGGVEKTDDHLCKEGHVGPTCANCRVSYRKTQLGCDVCSSWVGLAGVNWVELVLAVFLGVCAALIALKVMDNANPEDIIKCKILISFGQVLTSFAQTYSIEWNLAPGIMDFMQQLKMFNFNIFEVGSLECEFPGVKNFYTRFMGTVSMPFGLLLLIYLMWKSKMKAIKMMRKQDYAKSMLEVKIEDIEITGGAASKAFFVIIFLYLKVSQTTLDMFKCRRFRPSDEFLKKISGSGYGLSTSLTDRSYLEADLTLPCAENQTYTIFYTVGIVFVFIYPIGVPFFFGWLMFRERDQIHDAVNKKKYGFLFKDYAAAFFFWEIWDLIRKIALSGILIFFNRGSVGQVVVAMLIALFALELQLKVMPFDSQVANYIQVMSFNCIFLTLLGALLLKVKMVQGVDNGLGAYFCNVFLLAACSGVPVACLVLTLWSIGYEFWMTSAGQRANRLMLSAQRKALLKAQHAQALSGRGGTGAAVGGGGALGLIKGGGGFVKEWVVHTFWKREDVEGYLLSQELDMVRERREQRDQARVLLHEAKITLSEKREWLRFIKNNAQNEEEFIEFMENESIETYKKLILGHEINENQADVWGEFAGEDLNEAYSNPVFANRYKKSSAFTTRDELEKQIRAEYKIIK